MARQGRFPIQLVTVAVALVVLPAVVMSAPAVRTAELTASPQDNLESVVERAADLSWDDTVDRVSIMLKPGVYRLNQALNVDGTRFGPAQVTWQAIEPGKSVFSGGLAVEGPWSLSARDMLSTSGSDFSIYSAAAPASLKNPDGTWRPVRQLYVDGVRYNRTRSPAESFLLDPTGNAANITADGYQTASTLPQQWADPTSVEFVSDHTWMQHRCVVKAVAPIHTLPGNGKPCVANWTAKVEGTSPGSSLRQINASSWEECQQACCETGPACLAIIFHPTINNCYLLDRRYQPNYQPGEGSFVANMNEPHPQYRTTIDIAQPCFSIATNQGRYDLTYPSFVENTGNFTEDGQWWYDGTRGRFFIRPAAGVDLNSSTVEVGFAESLLNVTQTNNMTWSGLTFEYATWLGPNAGLGFVERYGNTYFAADRSLLMPHVAVNVTRSVNIAFDNCTFQHLGAWALGVGVASQHVDIRGCHFLDLSGGSILLGDVNDSNQTHPVMQTAHITVQDNSIIDMSQEYKGAPGLHSYCIVNSSIIHNKVSGVGYTGISYNWPLPQGPTLGPEANASRIGYSANNFVGYNDVSRFMGYMLDGGGIHTIGRSYNTSVVGNYFHDALSGQPGQHSAVGQSIVYIDNWSCFFEINDTVIDNCPHTQQGPWYFQQSNLGSAHDNYVNRIYLRNAGHLSGHSLPCNCTDVVNVTSSSPFPPEAQKIIDNAGPRQ